MTKRAVVIGIDDYSRQVTGWGSLGGCVNDADAVRHLLLDSFGFDPAGITLLKDAAASSANIRRSLAYMLAVSYPGDVAFMYYAGHGGLHPGADSGTYYQSIIPHTGRYITDWDLWHAADQLRPSEVNLTVVLDCCHSGGMGDPAPDGTAARTASLTQEAIDVIVATMETVVPFGISLPDVSTLANNVQQVMAAPGPLACYTEQANREFVTAAKATLLSASRWDETAGEAVSASGTRHGLLTQAIIDTVNACPYEATHEELHSLLHTRVHELSDDRQSPVLRGQANRAGHTFLAPFTDSR